MSKARLIGQRRLFVPNKYADIRRRPATTLARLGRMELQAEERKVAKAAKEVESWKMQKNSSSKS